MVVNIKHSSIVRTSFRLPPRYVALYKNVLMRELQIPADAVFILRRDDDPDPDPFSSSDDPVSDPQPPVPRTICYPDELDPDFVDRRISLLNDVLPVHFLGKWCASTRRQVEKAFAAVNKKRQQIVDEIVRKKRKQQSWGDWMRGRSVAVTDEDLEADETTGKKQILSSTEREELLDKLSNEVDGLQEVDVPGRVSVGMLCSSFSVTLVEDDGSGVSNGGVKNNEHRQVMDVDPAAVLAARIDGLVFEFSMLSKVDCRGNDSSEFVLCFGNDSLTVAQYGQAIVATKAESGSSADVAGGGAGAWSPGRGGNLYDDPDDLIIGPGGTSSSASPPSRTSTTRGGAPAHQPPDRISLSKKTILDDIEQVLDDCLTYEGKTSRYDMQELREQLADRGRNRGKILVYNKLDVKRNCLGISYEALPLQCHFRPGLLPNIQRFFDVAKQVSDALAAMEAEEQRRKTRRATMKEEREKALSKEVLGDLLALRKQGAPSSSPGDGGDGFGEATRRGAATTTFYSDPAKNHRAAEMLDRGVEMFDSAIVAAADSFEKNRAELAKRVPDVMDIYLTLLSPLIEFETETGARATFSLGNLQLFTPLAIDLEHPRLCCHMNETTLKVSTAAQERFYVLRPVPISVELEVELRPGLTAVSVGVQIQHMVLHLAPQALKVLLAVPAMAQAALVGFLFFL